MKRIIFLLVLLNMALKPSNCQSLQELLVGKIDVVVAADGSGDYTTLMEAINALSGSQVIFIKNGVYTEKVEILSNKNNLTFIGESVDSTIIQYGDYSGSGKIYDGILSNFQGNEIGTSSSHSFYNQSYDLSLMNLTIKNIAGDVGQAVALNLNQERTRIFRCRIMGNQDTFLTWKAARHLIKDCFIEGDVDFIFGGGAVIFDSCVINSNRGGSHITAPATAQNWNFGYVFQNCIITANKGVTGVFFARPWHNYPKVTFMNSYLGGHIAPAGWDNPWGLPEEDCSFYEYKNFGPGSGTSNRVNWSAQLSQGVADLFVEDNIFGTYVSTEVDADWHPEVYADSIYSIIRANTALLYTENYNSAYLDTIKYNDSSISDLNENNFSYAVQLPKGTSEIPVITVVPNSRKATVDITQASGLPGSASIKVTSGNGVEVTYSITFTIQEGQTSTYNEYQENPIRVLENPVVSQVDFELSNIQSTINFILFNSSGQVVISESFQCNQTKEIKSFNIEREGKGIYFYCFSYENKIINGKIIKI